MRTSLLVGFLVFTVGCGSSTKHPPVDDGANPGGSHGGITGVSDGGSDATPITDAAGDAPATADARD